MRAAILLLHGAIAAEPSDNPFLRELASGTYDYSGTDAQIDAQWDSKGSCNKYFNSPIDVPRKQVRLRDASTLDLDSSDVNNVYYKYTSVDMTNMAPKMDGGKKKFHVDLNATLHSGNILQMPTATSNSQYEPLQWHWHFSSEHTIDGQRYPGELHIVHKRKVNGGLDANELEYLVLGFMLTPKAGGTDLLTDLWSANTATNTYNLKTIFGDQMKGEYLRWKGGLTTPTCDQVVEWVLFTTPYEVNAATLAAMGQTWNGVGADGTPTGVRNNRPVQPIHGRKILRNTLVSYARPTSFVDYKATPWTSGVCNTGQKQSPVNIQSKDTIAGWTKVNAGWLDANTEGYNGPLNHKTVVDAAIKNNGHGYNVEFGRPNGEPITSNKDSNSEYNYRVKNDGKWYHLKQFHIHCPAEHTIDDAQYDCEIHFVHLNEAYTGSDVDAVVLGFFLKKGGDGDFLTHFGWGSEYGLPTYKGDKRELPPFSIVDLFQPYMTDYYRYDGGLTTPPCTEGVKFILFKQPIINLSDAQLAEFHRNFHGNNRPVQPLQGRKVNSNDMGSPGTPLMDQPSSASVVSVWLSVLFASVLAIRF